MEYAAESKNAEVAEVCYNQQYMFTKIYFAHPRICLLTSLTTRHTIVLPRVYSNAMICSTLM